MTTAPLTSTDLQVAITQAVRALPALPEDDPDDRYGLRLLTATWLASKRSPRTRTEYFRDLGRYLAWVQGDGLDPTTARPADVIRWVAGLDGSPATVSLAIAVVGSWYKFLCINGKTERNPVDGVTRPAVNRDESTTTSLEVADMKALMRKADELAKASDRLSFWRRLTAYRDRAILRLLADLGPRREEIAKLDLDNLSYNRGHRTLRYIAKGGKLRERPIPPHSLEALDEYLEIRGDAAGPLFVTVKRDGSYGRIDAKTGVYDVVRRIAVAADLPQAHRLGAHGMRHSFATNALDHGAALKDVQDAMGHADPRTTRRYDRARGQLHNDPALLLGGLYTTD